MSKVLDILIVFNFLSIYSGLKFIGGNQVRNG